MNKTKIMLGIFLTITLLTVVACQAELVTTTTTMIKTVTPAEQTVTMTPTTQTLTITETTIKISTVTATPAVSTTTTQTSTTTSQTTAITTTSTVLSSDSKLQLVNPELTRASNYASVSGYVVNLSTETLSARIAVEFRDNFTVAIATAKTDVLNIAPGEQLSFTVTSNASQIGNTASFKITVTVIS